MLAFFAPPENRRFYRGEKRVSIYLDVWNRGTNEIMSKANSFCPFLKSRYLYAFSPFTYKDCFTREYILCVYVIRYIRNNYLCAKLYESRLVFRYVFALCLSLLKIMYFFAYIHTHRFTKMTKADRNHVFGENMYVDIRIKMPRTAIPWYYLWHPREFLLASAGAFYAPNIGRVLRGSDGGVADRHWPITIFCHWKHARASEQGRGVVWPRVYATKE